MDEVMINELYESLAKRSRIPRKATRKPIPANFSLAGTCYIVAGSEEESRAIRDKLKYRALLRAVTRYRSDQYFGPEKAEMFLIRTGGDVSSLTLLSSGFSWIGMHVGDKICAVTMDDLLCKRPANKTQLYPHYLMKSAVADMMGAMLPADHIRMTEEYCTRRMVPVSIDEPYAVVSVTPCSLGREEFQDSSSAINFLNEKLAECSTMSYENIEQIAICALSYLFGQEFNPSKIKVCGWGTNGADAVFFAKNKESVLQAINTSL